MPPGACARPRTPAAPRTGTPSQAARQLRAREAGKASEELRVGHQARVRARERQQRHERVTRRAQAARQLRACQDGDDIITEGLLGLALRAGLGGSGRFMPVGFFYVTLNNLSCRNLCATRDKCKSHHPLALSRRVHDMTVAMSRPTPERHVAVAGPPHPEGICRAHVAAPAHKLRIQERHQLRLAQRLGAEARRILHYGRTGFISGSA